MTRNDAHHTRSKVKHIDIKHHFIRDEIAKKNIRLEWVPSEDQYADILTKALLPRLFLKFQSVLVSPLPQNNN